MLLDIQKTTSQNEVFVLILRDRERRLVDSGAFPDKAFFLPDSGIAFDATILVFGADFLQFDSNQFLAFRALYLLSS